MIGINTGRLFNPASTIPGPTGLLRNIVSYYKFDENTGTSVGDATGNGHGGTWQGTLGSQWTTGKINSGGNFNGTDNGVQSTIANPLLNGSFTLSAWVKFTAFQASTTDSVVKVDAGADFFWGQIYVHDFAGTKQARFITDDGAGHQSASPLSSGLSTATWYHLVGVRDTSQTLVIFYLNGSLVGSAADGSTTVPTYNKFNIGYNPGPTTQNINGILDEVGVWSRALSASEITSLYNSGAGLSFSNFH